MYKAAKIRGVPGARREASGREIEQANVEQTGGFGIAKYISPRESIFRVEFVARSSLTATGSDSRSGLAFLPSAYLHSTPYLFLPSILVDPSLPFTPIHGVIPR